MSYSDDTAAFMFSGLNAAEDQGHKHDHVFRKATAEGWVFTCECGHSILRSNEWMADEGKRLRRTNSMTG